MRFDEHFFNYVVGAVNKKRVSSPSKTSTTPYIIGGVVGFLVLLILISVLAYCLHKKRKVRKDENDPHKSQPQNQLSMPSMPSITDCFTHAQFQSVVNFPKNNSPFQRQRSVRFNYNVVMYGYDPQQKVRKSLKIKKKITQLPVWVSTGSSYK